MAEGVKAVHGDPDAKATEIEHAGALVAVAVPPNAELGESQVNSQPQLLTLGFGDRVECQF